MGKSKVAAEYRTSYYLYIPTLCNIKFPEWKTYFAKTDFMIPSLLIQGQDAPELWYSSVNEKVQKPYSPYLWNATT